VDLAITTPARILNQTKGWGDAVADRIAQAIWFAILLICLIAADQALNAQQDVYSAEEQKICIEKPHSVKYETDSRSYSVPFEDIDGQAVVEGDIVIGTTADLPTRGTNYIAPIVPDYIKGKPKRWGKGIEPYVVPYVIDNSVQGSDQKNYITQAISLWANHTGIRLQPLSGPRDWIGNNYVKFISKNLCASYGIGMAEKPANNGTEDANINVVDVAECKSWGMIAHEIGHVLGLGHEQSRSDRNSYITVLWDNIKPAKKNDAFEPGVQYCRAIGDPHAKDPYKDLQTLANTYYDYDSIMHYSVLGFAKDKSCKLERYKDRDLCLAFRPNQGAVTEQEHLLRKEITIGQRDHLSEGDIALVNALYPRLPPSDSPPNPPTKVQPCSVVTETKITEGGATTTTTTRTGPCPDDQRPPVSTQCCREKIVVTRPCYPGGCRPPVKVSWPRPDRWCRSGWCRPRPRPLCERDGWGDDDWDDRW
jgi:hypothetical protein